MDNIFIRARNGDSSVLSDFSTLNSEEKERCVTCVAQFGRVDLLKNMINRYDIQEHAEHALWVAAHDSQFQSVQLLTLLVAPTSPVWESVLRYATMKNYVDLQNTILSFDPLVNVDSCLYIAACVNNKRFLETLLKRAQDITASTVMKIMDNGWWDVVDTSLPRLSGDEANTLFLQSIEQKKWDCAQQLVPYCDVASLVKTAKKGKRPDQETRDQLQRLILLEQTKFDAEIPSIKRKM